MSGRKARRDRLHQERLEEERAEGDRRARRRRLKWGGAGALGLLVIAPRHYSAIMAGGGAILIVMGVLIWTGELFRLNIEAQRFLESVGLDFFSEV